MTNNMNNKVGLWTATATAVGIVVASSVMVSLGQGYGLGGPGFIIAMVVALLLNVLVAFTFAELSGMMPKAGGMVNYTLPALGPFVGMVSVLSGYVLVSMFAGGAEMYVAGVIVNDVFDLSISPTIVSVIFVAALVLVNIRGVKLFGKVQVALTSLMILSIVIIGLIGLTGTGSGEPLETSIEFNPLGVGIFSLVALAFWLFVGIEFVTPMAEELKNPKVYIPLSMVLGLLIILVADLIFGNAAIKYVPLDVLANSDSPHMDTSTAILGRTGQIWMGIVTILATSSTLNTLLYAIPKMLQSMAELGQLPKVFAKLNKWGTPWISIIFMGALMLMLVVANVTATSSITTFILAGALCWCITYIIAHINVIVLRFKYPNMKRSFKSPLGVTFQIIGIIGMVFMVINIHPDPMMKTQIYQFAFVFLAFVVIFSLLWIKIKMKMKLFQTTNLSNQESSTGNPNEEPILDEKPNINTN
ncbi:MULTISPECIES: APC family permease [Paraliobacillus]|uniref:APC family permease n=1 Tax=Paraliobacillus TaxID=200903 RepID=UPI000DD4757B|nr:MULTISPECIES: APC family permease [Paraliobacillus]